MKTLEEVLNTPERRAQFADLQQNPVGSVRDLAKRWGIKHPAAQRFLNALKAAGIGVHGGTTCTVVGLESVSGQADTVAQSVSGVSASKEDKCIGADTVNPAKPALTVSGGCHLDTLDNSLDSRCTIDRYTSELIGVMNAELAPRFSDFWPVSRDNHGSHRNAKQWYDAGIPLDLAKKEVAEACRRFNPEKHGGGQLPKSLGVFRRGVIAQHNREIKRQNNPQREIGLPPVLKVERAEPRQPGKFTPIGDTLSPFMQAYHEKAGNE